MNELKMDAIAPVVLMHGKEDFLISWAVDLLKNKYVTEAASSVDYQVMDEDSSADQIVGAANTFSMFSQKRVVWVRDPRELAYKGSRDEMPESVAELVKYVNNPSDGSLLIISTENANGSSALVKAIKKSGSVYEFGTLTRAELKSFAAKRFRDAGLEISRGDMESLIDETGYFNKDSEYRLFHFENDLAKLVAIATDGRISSDDITEVVSGDEEKFIFSLLDAVCAGNKGKAFEILHNRISASGEGGKAEMGVLTAVISQFEVLLTVKEMMDSPNGRMNAFAIQKHTGMNEYRIKKAMSYARRFSLRKLRAMLSEAYDVGAKRNSGLVDIRTSLEILIAGI